MKTPTQCKNTLQEIISLADSLSTQDQQSLLDHLALQRKASRKVSTDTTRSDLWFGAVTEALDDVLRSGGLASPGLGILKKNYGDSFVAVETFIKSAAPTLTVTEKTAFYRILAKLLVEHADFVAKKSGIPLSAKLLFNCMGSLPGLVDNTFPGYTQAGLLPLVIKKM